MQRKPIQDRLQRPKNRDKYLLLFPFSAPCVGVARAAFVARVTSVLGASTWGHCCANRCDRYSSHRTVAMPAAAAALVIAPTVVPAAAFAVVPFGANTAAFAAAIAATVSVLAALHVAVALRCRLRLNASVPVGS